MIKIFLIIICTIIHYFPQEITILVQKKYYHDHLIHKIISEYERLHNIKVKIIPFLKEAELINNSQIKKSDVILGVSDVFLEKFKKIAIDVPDSKLELKNNKFLPLAYSELCVIERLNVPRSGSEMDVKISVPNPRVCLTGVYFLYFLNEIAEQNFDLAQKIFNRCVFSSGWAESLYLFRKKNYDSVFNFYSFDCRVGATHSCNRPQNEIFLDDGGLLIKNTYLNEILGEKVLKINDFSSRTPRGILYCEYSFALHDLGVKFLKFLDSGAVNGILVKDLIAKTLFMTSPNCVAKKNFDKDFYLIRFDSAKFLKNYKKFYETLNKLLIKN